MPSDTQTAFDSPGLTGMSGPETATPTPGLESLFGGHYVPSQAYIAQNPQQSSPTQLTQQEPWRANTLQAILAAIGGPFAGKTMREQGLQKQMGPIIGELSTKLNLALNNGDFETAQSLLSQFSTYAELTPLSTQIYQTFAQKLNEKYNNVESNQTMARYYGSQTKAGTPAEAFSKLLESKAVAAKLPPDFVQRTFAALHGAGFISGPFNLVRNPVTGQVDTSQTQVLPQAQTIPELTDPQKAVLDAQGIPYNVYTDIAAKKASGQLSPAEDYLYNKIQPELQKGVTQYNVAGRVPTTTVGEYGLTQPQRAEGAGLPQPGNLRGTVAQPSAPASQPVQVQPNTELTLTPEEAQQQIQEIQNSKMSQRGKDISIARIRELTSQPSTAQPETPQQQELGPTMAKQRTAIEADRTYATKAAQNTADVNTQQLPQEIGVRIKADGTIEALPNPTGKQIKEGKYAQFSQPTQQYKDVMNAVQIQKPIRDFVAIMQDKSIPSAQKEGVANALGQWAAEGFQVPFTKLFPRIGGGRTLVAPGLYAYTTALAQGIEKAINPENADNRQIDTVKRAVVSGMRTASGAVETVQYIDKFLTSKIEGLLAPQGAVAPKPAEAKPTREDFFTGAPRRVK